MKPFVKITALITFAVFFGMAARAQAFSFGTQSEARELVMRVAEDIRSKGLMTVERDINDQDGPYRVKDLQLFLLRDNGTVLAHSHNRAYVGKNMWNLTTVDNVRFVQELITAGQHEKIDHVDYRWSHPFTQKILWKRTYVERVSGVSVCSGAYFSEGKPE